jgi:hypothetical protein
MLVSNGNPVAISGPHQAHRANVKVWTKLAPRVWSWPSLSKLVDGGRDGGWWWGIVCGGDLLIGIFKKVLARAWQTRHSFETHA